jgi:predicted tellurium resistance membrane protein TerC
MFDAIQLPDFLAASTWISLLTLTFLEIVLGIDNIIFISIVAGKLPSDQQRRARNLGLMLAMVFRVVLLLTISWIIALKDPVLTLSWWSGEDGLPMALSWKDIILLAGGVFLIIKSLMELQHKTVKQNTAVKGQSKASRNFASVIIQILLVDAVFSFDSILTAVGLVDQVSIMIMAVVISIGIMMLFAGPVTRIINTHPTLQVLALAFLVVIGVVLVAEGLHQHISKNIIYTLLAFSLAVELINIRVRKNESAEEAGSEMDSE